MKTITVATRQDSLEIEFTLSWGDYADAELALRRKIQNEQGRSLHTLVPPVMAATLGSIGATLVWGALGHGATGVVGLIMLAAAPIALAFGALVERRIEQREFARFRNTSPRKQRCVANGDGLKFEQGSVQVSFPWSAVSRTYRLADNLVLFVGNLNYFLIPGRAFLSPGQQVSFLKLLKARVGPAIR